MADLVLKQIGADEPGWLGRMQKIARYRRVFSDGTYTEQDVIDLTDFLLDFVQTPIDKTEARILLVNASQNELLHIIAGIGGNTEDPFGTSEQK